MQIVISAIDNASKVLKNIESQVQQTADSMKRMGESIAKAGAIMSGISAPFIAGIGMAIKTGMDFEQQMKNVQSVLGGTQKDFELLSNYAKEMGKSSVFSASEAAQAMYYMASAGMKTDDIMSSLNSTLQLAAATNSDLAQTSDVVVSTLSQFSLSADEASRVADVFASAISNSQASLDKIQYSMRYVGPVANSLGYSLEETTASLMMLYNAGYKGEQAGTILRGALSSLMNTTSEAQKVIEKYNLEIYNTDGSLRDWGTILKQLESAHITTADAIKLFGQEAGPGIMAMINQGTDAFNKYLETLKKSEGAAQTMADTQINSISGMVKLIKSELESIEISIFDDMKGEIQSILETIKSLLPVLKEFTEYFIAGFKQLLNYVKPVGKKIIELFNSMSPELKKTIALIGGLGVAFAAIAGPALMVIGGITIGLGSIVSMAGSVMGAIGGITASISAAVASLSATFTAGGIAAVLSSIASAALPVVGAIAGLTAVIGGAIVAVVSFKKAWDENFGGIKEKVQDIIDELKTLARTLYALFSEAISGLVDFINALADTETVKSIVVGVVEAIRLGLIGLNDGIQKCIDWVDDLKVKLSEWGVINTAKSAFNSWKTAATTSLSMIKGAVIELSNTLSDKLSPVLDEHSELFGKIQRVGAIAFNALGNALKIYYDSSVKLLNAMKTAWDNNLYGIQDFVYGAIDVIVMLLDVVLSVVEGLIDALIWLYDNWANIMDTLTKLWNTGINAIIQFANGIIDVWNMLGKATADAWNNIMTIVARAWNGLVGIINKAINFYNTAAEKVGMDTISKLETVSIQQYQVQFEPVQQIKPIEQNNTININIPNVEVKSQQDIDALSREIAKQVQDALVQQNRVLSYNGVI